MTNIETAKGEIVMYQPDETIRLEVRMDGETVWLNQQQMAELFATDRTSIAKHILNVYETDELEKEPTCAKIAQVRQEGNRRVREPNVSATIYTKQTAKQFQLDVQRHNQQYPPIAIHTCQHNHDRFLIIDDVVYIFGASLKDAGKKLFAYIRMQDTSAAELLNIIR
ncbi:MAG: DNA-binding protein [Prevotella sp.]|nr:DNA-binding protein [Prevotella sp.]